MSHLPYVSSATRANWRDEIRVCPDCGENYWPAERTTKKRWDAQETCPDPCGRLRAIRTTNAARKNQMRKGDVV
jgi:hypothetical protein